MPHEFDVTSRTWASLQPYNTWRLRSLCPPMWKQAYIVHSAQTWAIDILKRDSNAVLAPQTWADLVQKELQRRDRERIELNTLYRDGLKLVAMGQYGLRSRHSGRALLCEFSRVAANYLDESQRIADDSVEFDWITLVR